MAKWNQCNVCGQFIGLDDFMGNPPKAVNKLVQPDSIHGPELWDTYHLVCEERQESINPKVAEKE